MTGYVTAAEAGDMLGVSASRVRQFVLEGRLPAQKIGSAILIISTKDIAKFRAKKRRKTKKSNGK